MSIWNDLSRSMELYRRCFPKGNYGLEPKYYGISIQGKHKKKKRGRNNGKRI